MWTGDFLRRESPLHSPSIVSDSFNAVLLPRIVHRLDRPFDATVIESH
jgi:hypothetical protein